MAIHKGKAVLGLLLMSSIVGVFPAWADVVVIVSAKSNLVLIQPNDAKKIFLGKRKKLANGAVAVPVYQGDQSMASKLLRDNILQKSAAQMKTHWSKLVFSGKGRMPKVLDSATAVIDYVVKTRGGIGYIDSSQVDNSVKVILTIKSTE